MAKKAATWTNSALLFNTPFSFSSLQGRASLMSTQDSEHASKDEEKSEASGNAEAGDNLGSPQDSEHASKGEEKFAVSEKIETGDEHSLQGEIEKLTNALKEEKEKAEEYLNRLKYLQADFINYQKKTKKELEEATKLGSERLIVRLLDVMDDLERALEVAEKTEQNSSLVKGVAMVLKEFRDILRQEGVTTIEATGKPFNPNLHEAVMQVESAELEDNTIVEELRKGYLFSEKVIRPSMVKVVKSQPKFEDKKENLGDNQNLK